MIEKTYLQKWWLRGWLTLFTIAAIGITAIVTQQINRPADDITGTVSHTEPPSKEEGTPAYPYADASRCPPRTDLVFWPSGRSVPSFPPDISVCFVGIQPFDNSGPEHIEVHDR